MSPADHLPWLIVHGETVYYCSLVVLFGVSLALIWLAQVAVARVENWLRRRQLGGALSTMKGAKDGDLVVLAGRLEVGGEATVRVEDGAEAAASTVFRSGWSRALAPRVVLFTRKAGELTLKVGDERVALEGEVETTLGSREHLVDGVGRLLEARRKTLAEHEAKALEEGPWRLVMKSLAAGDELLARGRLHRMAADEDGPAGYREQAAIWTMQPASAKDEGPTAEGAAIQLAFAGAPRFTRSVLRRLWRAGLIIVVAALLTAGIEHQVGKGTIDQAMATMEQNALVAPQLQLRCYRGDMLSDVELVAATHFRHAALTVLQDTYAQACTGSRDKALRLAALKLLYSDCEWATDTLFDHGLFQEAAELGESCGTPRSLSLASHSSYYLGDFAQASKLAEGGHLANGVVEARYHLLAGRLSLAAAAARRGMDGHSVSASRRAALECVADALAAREGSTEARERLQQRADKRDSRECFLLYADLLPPAERPAPGKVLSSHAGTLLTIETSPEQASKSPPLSIPDPLHILWAYWTPSGMYDGLSASALAALSSHVADSPAAMQLQGQLLASAAIMELIEGEHAQARQRAEEAVSALEQAEKRGSWNIEQRMVVPALLALIEIDAGDYVRARKMLERLPPDRPRYQPPPGEISLQLGSKYRNGPASQQLARALRGIIQFREHGSLAGLLVIVPEYDGLYSQAREPLWQAAGRGDGQLLGSVFWQRSRALFHPARLWAPRIDKGRQAFLDAVHYGNRTGDYLPFPLPMLHQDLGNRRSISAALGDEQAAARLGEIIGPVRKALLQRDIAVPLRILEYRF